MGLQVLFKVTLLEVESVLRDVCDRVLVVGSDGSREKVLLRVIALQVLGEAYMGVKHDPNAPRVGLGAGAPGGDDGKYIKVETKASRERAGRKV